MVEIWCCCTECDSVTVVHGYTTSKKQALEWMELELEISIPECGHQKPTMADKIDIGNGFRVMIDDCHDITIIKLKKV